MSESNELTYEPRKLIITYGDISLLQLPEGAIVNPSNTGMILNSGVSEQIARRAGPLFQQQLHILRSRMRNNQLELGRVIETDPGQVNAKYLLHASIIGKRATDIDLITTALLNVFDLADRLQLRSVAFPALGVGPKLPLLSFIELFWRLANEELPRSESLESVILCLLEEEEFNTTYEYIQKHEELIGEDIEVEVVKGSVWDNLNSSQH